MKSSIDSESVLPFMKELASDAGTIVMSYFQGQFDIESKDGAPNGIDIVTDADKASERFIMDQIRKSFPSHDILTEESTIESTGSRFLWIIDPLDGTVNFAHSYPHFCVSIGFMEENVIKAGVVFDPIRQEMFWASSDGAFLNGHRAYVTRNDNMFRCVLGTGFPYDKARSTVNNLKEFHEVIPRVQGIRRSGSAALDLAWVACGRLDGFWELKLKPWDFTAGILLIEQAGGRVTDRYGLGMETWSQSIVATNSLIHDELVHVLSLTD
ncbi:MAG: inositol monophosphatase family protein [Deltaproteobacteria bacterium]|nr:inositol monophosphatase family protein [Deltaproteobacteria bacterium]